jgi:hypothetical protein
MAREPRMRKAFMKLGQPITIYLDNSLLAEIDRRVRKPTRWLMYSPCWRSRSSFIADACAQMIASIKRGPGTMKRK